MRVCSLAGLVKNKLGKGPADRRSVIFIGKSGNQMRLLQWDTDGYDLCVKRLESGGLERPASGQAQLSAGELCAIEP